MFAALGQPESVGWEVLVVVVAGGVVVDLAVVVVVDGLVVDVLGRVVDVALEGTVAVVDELEVVDDVEVVVAGGLGPHPHLRQRGELAPSAGMSVGHFQAAAMASCPEPSIVPPLAEIEPSNEKAPLTAKPAAARARQA